MRTYFSCKNGVNIEDFYAVNPYLFKIFTSFLIYCTENRLPCVITSIREEARGRVTNTHASGRAFDASSRGWSELHIHRLIKKINEEYKSIGAISKSDGESRAVVYHMVEGNAFHFHFQVRPNILME